VLNEKCTGRIVNVSFFDETDNDKDYDAELLENCFPLLFPLKKCGNDNGGAKVGINV